MKLLDRKKAKKYILLIIILFFIITIVYYYKQDIKNMESILSHVTKGDVVDFNYDSGFYDKTLNIKLKLNNALPNKSKISNYFSFYKRHPNTITQRYYQFPQTIIQYGTSHLQGNPL